MLLWPAQALPIEAPRIIRGAFLLPNAKNAPTKLSYYSPPLFPLWARYALSWLSARAKSTSLSKSGKKIE